MRLEEIFKDLSQEVVDKFLSKIVKDVNTQSCWYHRMDSDPNRYQIRFAYRQKMFNSRKFSYLHFRGKIKANHSIFSSCADPLCINPDHLYLGAPGENMRILIHSGWKKVGIKHTEESKRKMSLARKGKALSQHAREAISLGKTGKKWTPKQRKILGEYRIKNPPVISKEGKLRISYANRGENNYISILTERDVLEIRGMNFKKEGLLIKDVALEYGVSPSTIGDLLSKRTWKHI